VLADGVVDQIVARVLEGPELERLVGSPAIERLVMGVVESPATERLVTGVIDSRLLDQVVTRLLESEELWLLVEEIARSPAVTEAITQQSLGFADVVGDEVRKRSGNADAWLERAARRVRHPRRDGAGAGASDPTRPAPTP
jgi:hypothetical protein